MERQELLDLLNDNNQILQNVVDRGDSVWEEEAMEQIKINNEAINLL